MHMYIQYLFTHSIYFNVNCSSLKKVHQCVIKLYRMEELYNQIVNFANYAHIFNNFPISGKTSLQQVMFNRVGYSNWYPQRGVKQ